MTTIEGTSMNIATRREMRDLVTVITTLIATTDRDKKRLKALKFCLTWVFGADSRPEVALR